MEKLKFLKKLSRFRNIILIVTDILCIAIAYILGVLLVSEDTLFNMSSYYINRLQGTIGLSIIVYQLVFHLTKKYKQIIRYENSKDY